MQDPYASETTAAAMARHSEEWDEALDERDFHQTLATADAHTLRALLADWMEEQPSTRIPAHLHARDWSAWHKRTAASRAAWVERLDLIARAYVRAIDAEAGQLALPGVRS